MPLLLHRTLSLIQPLSISRGNLARLTFSKIASIPLSTSNTEKPRFLSQKMEPLWSEGTEEATKKEALQLISGGRWRLSVAKVGIERRFEFKTFAKTMIFINQIADQCKVKKHHPEWANVYNQVVIRWTTHNPEGLSHKDVEMAKFCDEKGKELGEVAEGKLGEEGPSAGAVGVGKSANILDSLLGDGVQKCCLGGGGSKKS